MPSSLSSHDKLLYLPGLVFYHFRSKQLRQGPLCLTGTVALGEGWGERWRSGERSAPTALIKQAQKVSRLWVFSFHLWLFQAVFQVAPGRPRWGPDLVSPEPQAPTAKLRFPHKLRKELHVKNLSVPFGSHSHRQQQQTCTRIFKDSV